MRELQEKLNGFLKLSHIRRTKEELTSLYDHLIDEEYEELNGEYPRTYEEFKELCDLLWVIIQYANVQGYDLEKGMNALCDEYKSKFYTKDGLYAPIYRQDGKLLKNTGFKPANFKELYKKDE